MLSADLFSLYSDGIMRSRANIPEIAVAGHNKYNLCDVDEAV